MEISLKEFVQETLNEIIEGIVNSQNHMKAKYVNEKDPNIAIESGRPSKVEFDVSVESSKNVEASGKAGISIKVLEVGGNAKELVANKNENRIKFSVFITVSTVNNYPTSA